MPTLAVKRNVTETVTRQATVSLDITTAVKDGNFVVYVNGERAVAITKGGHLRRYRGLTAASGVNRLPDGRIAIAAKAAA